MYLSKCFNDCSTMWPSSVVCFYFFPFRFSLDLLKIVFYFFPHINHTVSRGVARDRDFFFIPPSDDSSVCNFLVEWCFVRAYVDSGHSRIGL